MKNFIIKHRKGKHKGVKIEWLGGKKYQLTWLGNYETVENLNFTNGGKIRCGICGKIHFNFSFKVK